MSQLSNRLQRTLDTLSWRTRLLVHLEALAHATGSKAHWRLGCAILNLERDKVPRIEGPAEIETTGEFDKNTGLEIGRMFVTVISTGSHGYHEKHTHQFLMTTLRFRDEFRRMADAIKCTDAERLELFAELQKFIGRDHRANPDLGGNIKEI